MASVVSEKVLRLLAERGVFGDEKGAFIHRGSEEQCQIKI